MSRRISLGFRKRRLNVSSNCRMVSEVYAMFLAMILFMVVSHVIGPMVLNHFTSKGDKSQSNVVKDTRMRVRTRERSEKETRDHKPYTGHAPYVTDNIIDLVFDADGCPGSPPLLRASKNTQNEQEVVGDPLKNLNLMIHRGGRSKNLFIKSIMNGTSQSNEGHPSRDQKGYDALFIVCSNVKYATNRKYFRQIYGNFSNTWPYRIKVVFLVGRPSSEDVFQNVSNEARLFSDIVMGNFVDHYDNLTYKTIMGYRWVHTHCPDVNLMLKLDDDVFLDVFKFFDVFRPRIEKQKERTINCFLNKKPRVHRVGKYQVSEDEFTGKQYPQFCSGFFVVPTLDVVQVYASLYKDIRFFRLEDVFSYGMMREAMVGVQLVHTDLVTVESYEYLNCVLRYKYRCKYMAAQVPYQEFPTLMKTMVAHRALLGLHGTDTDTMDDDDDELL